MKYNYCPKCDRLRPRTFLMGNRCEGCHNQTVTIVVKRSWFGIAMYALSLLAGALVILYVAHRDLNADFAGFMAGISDNLFIIMVFGLIAASFVMSFLDLGRTNAEARRIVDERKGQWKY